MNELPLFVHWEKFLGWLLARTQNYPKKSRFTFVNRIDNLALDILEQIVEAAYSPRPRKRDILRRVNLALEKLRVLLRLSRDCGYLNGKSCEYAMRELETAGRMVGGWLKDRADK